MIAFFIIYLVISLYCIFKDEKIRGMVFSTGYRVKIVRALTMLVIPVAIYLQNQMDDKSAMLTMGMSIFVIVLFSYLETKLLFRRVSLILNHPMSDNMMKEFKKRIFNIKIVFGMCCLYALITLSIIFLPK